MALDTIDVKILEVLQENARVSISELSKQVNLSLSAVSERLKKLESSSIIEQYRKQLSSGSSGDWESVLAEMNGKLEANGINTIVETYQTQLDAWVAEQG